MDADVGSVEISGVGSDGKFLGRGRLRVQAWLDGMGWDELGAGL